MVLNMFLLQILYHQQLHFFYLHLNLYINWVFDAKLYRKMIKYSLPLLFAGLAGMTNEAIDRILLKFYISDTNVAMSELGIYGAFL